MMQIQLSQGENSGKVAVVTGTEASGLQLLLNSDGCPADMREGVGIKVRADTSKTRAP